MGLGTGAWALIPTLPEHKEEDTPAAGPGLYPFAVEKGSRGSWERREERSLGGWWGQGSLSLDARQRISCQSPAPGLMITPRCHSQHWHHHRGLGPGVFRENRKALPPSLAGGAPSSSLGWGERVTRTLSLRLLVSVVD